MKFPTRPGDLGHEAWGFVDRIGDGVEGISVGTRVCALSYRAFAEYDVAAQDAVVQLPTSLDGLAAPGEPLACAVNVVERSRIEPGESVAVVGVGFLGALLVQLARRRGARVVGLSRRKTALDAATRMGAQSAIVVAEMEPTLQAASEANDGALFDCVIEATGAQAGLDLAAQLTRERGRLVIAGYHQDGPRSVDMQLWNWRGLDVVNAHERDPAIYMRGMKRGIALMEAGALQVSALLTHSYPLEKLADALDATRDRPEGFMKAVISYM